MTAIICRACGCGDDLGDGGYEVGFDWDRSLCADCVMDEDEDDEEVETILGDLSLHQRALFLDFLAGLVGAHLGIPTGETEVTG